MEFTTNQMRKMATLYSEELDTHQMLTQAAGEIERLYNALEQIATNEAHDENEYSIEDWKGLVHDLRNCARQAIAKK